IGEGGHGWLVAHGRWRIANKARRAFFPADDHAFELLSFCHPERSRGTLCLIPLSRQIFPPGIELRDQPEFLLAAPALKLFLAVNGIAHILEALPVYEANCIVVVGEAF